MAQITEFRFKGCSGSFVIKSRPVNSINFIVYSTNLEIGYDKPVSKTLDKQVRALVKTHLANEAIIRTERMNANHKAEIEA